MAQSAFALTVYDPTNHTENLATKLQMIEQVKNSAQQLQNDIKNLQKLDPSELQLSLNYIQETIQDLNRLREQTDAIGTEYDQLMSEWDEANPDYEEWNGVDAEMYAKQTDKLRDKWSKALLQALTAQSIASPSEQLRTDDAMERLLNASQNADGAMGALQACQDSNLDIPIIGIDATYDALCAVKDGTLAADVYQDVYGQAEEAFNVCVRILNGTDYEKTTYVPFQLITQENVDEYLENF